MDLKSFDCKKIIFRQGDPGDCMYDIQYGKVGIFLDYGGANEKKIAELFPGQLFGEMGLLDHVPRSATAVALEDGTVLDTISEDDFQAYFKEQPSKVLLLMEQMCSRLRRTTRDYQEACRTVYETAEAEKTGAQKSAGLLERIGKFCERYRDFGPYTRT